MAEQGIFKNQIVIKNGDSEKKLDQIITLNSYINDNGDTNLFCFSGEFDVVPDPSKPEVHEIQTHQILAIEKRVDNSYGVRIKKPEIFKNESGNGLDSLGLTKDGNDYVLNIDPSSPAVAMRNKGEELIVEVKSTDGKSYKITAGATGITIEYGDEVFAYQTSDDNTLVTNIDSSVIEEFLDKSKTVCKTPAKLSDFPNYLIGLFASSVEKNDFVEYGDYKITKIDLSPDGQSQPYLFVTKTDNSKSPSTQTNYIFINGRFQKCNNYLLQYEKSDDGITMSPSIVLEVSPLRKTKNSTMKYYSIPLSQDGDSLSQASINAIARINDIADNVSVGQDVAILGNATSAYNFYAKDSREYAKDYKFAIKPVTYVHNETDNANDSNANPVNTPKTRNTSLEQRVANLDKLMKEIQNQVKLNGINDDIKKILESAKKESQSIREKLNDSIEGKEELETKLDKIDNFIDSLLEKRKEIKVDLSKPVETLSTVSSYAGLFLLAASALTGPLGAVLAPVGIALAAGGTVGGMFADKAKFKIFQRAKNRVKQYEEQEQKDYGFASMFLENENELSQIKEQANEQEEQLLNMLTDSNSPLYQFSEVYNQYGVGFINDLSSDSNELSKTAMLCGYDGLALRTKMLNDINAIRNSTTPANRALMIDKFINMHFHSMPATERKKVEALFDTTNQPTLKTLVEMMKKTNEQDGKVKSKIAEQINSLAVLSDTGLERLVRSNKMDSAQRERFFLDYGTTIIRRFAFDKNFNVTKLTSLIACVPPAERSKVTKILQDSANRIDSKLFHTKFLAYNTKQSVQTVVEAQYYGKAIKDLTDHPDNYSSQAHLVKATGKFLQAYDYEFYSKEERVKALNNLRSKPEETLNLNKNAQATATNINNLIDKVNKGDKGVQDAWLAVYNKIAEVGADGKSILDEIASTYGQGYSSLYPNTSVDRLDYKKTIIEIARKQNNPELLKLVKIFNDKTNQSSNNLASEIPSYLTTIETELAEYGITLDDNLISKTADAINPTYIGDPSNKERIAKIKLQIAEKVALLINDKSPESQQLIAHLKKVDKFVDKIVNGDLAVTQVSTSITKAIKDISPSIDYKKGMAREEGKNVDKAVDGLAETNIIINKFTREPDREEIKAKFNNKINNGMKPNEALLEALKETLGTKQYENLSLSYDQLIAKHTENGEININGLMDEASSIILNLNSQAENELNTFEDDLGDKLGQAEYNENRNTDDILSWIISPKQDNVLEYFLQYTGKSLNQIVDILSSKLSTNQDITLEDVLIKGLGLTKDDINKANSQFKFRDNEKTDNILNAIKEIINCKKSLYMHKTFKMAWYDALATGNTQNLTTFLKIYNKELGQTSSDLLKIIQTSDPKKIKDALLEYDKNNLLFKKLDKEDEKMKVSANRARLIASLPTEEGREYTESQFAIADIDSKILEFKAKLNAILNLENAGYDKLTINEAMDAFINGDEKFFLAHPEIKLAGPYFFSNQDVQLLADLKIKSKKLKQKNKFKLIHEIETHLASQRESAVKVLEKLKAKMESYEQSKPRLNKKGLDDFKDKLHFTRRTLAEVNREVSNPQSSADKTPQERLAEMGLIYEDEHSIQ